MYGESVSAKQAAAPQTTMELLKYIARKIPERILKALPMTIIVGAISWLVHTFLLVYTNEGFNPDTWLGKNFLNVKGYLVSSTLLWLMIGAIIPMAVSFFMKGGNPFKTFTGIIKMPSDIIKKNKDSSNAFLPVILISCSVALLFDKLLSGFAGLVAGGILMSSVIAFVTGRGSIFIQVFRMVFSDIQAFILKKQRFRLDSNSIYLIIGSSGVVLFLFGILGTFQVFPFIFGKLGALIPFMAGFFNVILLIISFILYWLWLVLLVLGILLYTKTKPVPRQMIFFAALFLSVIAADRIFGLRILADDGGWQEAGGTFGQWVGSEGFFPAVMSGIPPAAAGLIGSYVSSILGGLFEGFGPSGIDIPAEPVQPQTPDLTQPTQPTDPTQPTQPTNEPLTDEEKLRQEQERLRLEEERRRQEEEQERIRREFEDRRQQEIERQMKEREKALKELEKIRLAREERQRYIDKLCAKYNTTPDKLRDVLRKNIDANAADARRWDDEQRKWAIAETAATIVLVAADTTIDGLANMTGPVGRGIRAGYKVTKGAASSMAENGVSVSSALSGATTGGADAITDFVDHAGAKAAITIAGETLGGVIQNGAAGAKDGLIKGVYSAGSNFTSDKLAGKGYGNDMVQTFNKNGTATVAVNSGGTWVTKTLSGQNAINFANKKIGQQLTQSSIKGTVSLGNELGAKPALQNAGVLPK
ncbi:MAG: coiled-coil domain-containing protein [Saccharofermentanales bacterium]